MRSILFCLMFLGFASVGVSSTKSSVGNVGASASLKADSDSYYHKVKNLFTSEDAGIPSFVSGDRSAHIGRCYRSHKPDTAIAGGYLVRFGSEDGGPHGPIGESETLVATIWSTTEAADHFDDKTLEELFEKNRVDGPAAIDYDAYGLKLTYADSAGKDTISILRQNGTYFVEEVTFGDGEVVYCYYFIHK